MFPFVSFSSTTAGNTCVERVQIAVGIVRAGDSNLLQSDVASGFPRVGVGTTVVGDRSAARYLICDRETVINQEVFTPTDPYRPVKDRSTVYISRYRTRSRGERNRERRAGCLSCRK